MKKRGLLLPLCLFVLVLGLLTAGHLLTKSTGRLTDAAVLQFRLSYPICTAISDEPEPTLEELQTDTYSFVYGQILSEPAIVPYLAISERTSSALISSQRNNKPAEFYSFSFEIIGDTEGLFQPEEVIPIAMDFTDIDYYPSFQKGMRLVIPVPKESAATSLDLWLCHSRQGMFYVTNTGYVLSMYDETAYPSGTAEFNNLSGLPVETLLEFLKK